MAPYGIYIAARMNAELGKQFDIHRMINWLFGPDSVNRPNWRIMADKWDGIDE